jgi:hypothetical protein
MGSANREPCGRSEWRSEQFTLVAAFAQLREPGAPQQHDHMYGTTTSVEFHRLLVAALFAYGKVLCALNKTCREDLKGRVQKCLQVWYRDGLLREMWFSLMLRQHLETCRKWLDFPTNNQGRLVHYEEYTGFPSSGYKDPDVDKPGCVSDGEILEA